MFRMTIAALIAMAPLTAAHAATSLYRPVTSLKVKPSTMSNTTRFKVNPTLARPTFGNFRRPLNRADPLNPQPLPPGPPPQSRINIQKMPAPAAIQSR